MRFTRRQAILAAAAFALLACGCVDAINWESWGQARNRAVARERGLGGWVTLRFDDTTGSSDVSGELIAVGKDSLLLLNAGNLVAIRTSALGSVLIEIREDTLSSTIDTLPPVQLVRPSPRHWHHLTRFARFPQGLPAGADSLLRSAR